MGGGQSQESPTATATRNSADQRIGGRDVSSRKSAGGVPPSSSSQIDSSRRRYLVVDGQKGEGGGEIDESPSARHHGLSQPASRSNHHPHPSRSHPHTHSHHGNGHNQRPHPHRQQRQHQHHNHRPPPPPIPDSFPPVDMELSMPFLTSRSQPMANEPATESLHPELGLVLPSRHRRYYEAGNPEDLQLDLSMASLSRRLRAVGLIAEDSGNGVSGGSGNGGSGSSSSRRHHRPRRHHSHSSHSGRSRHHLGAPNSVVLVRGLSASEFVCVLSIALSLSSLPLSPTLPPSVSFSHPQSVSPLFHKVQCCPRHINLYSLLVLFTCHCHMCPETYASHHNAINFLGIPQMFFQPQPSCT